MKGVLAACGLVFLVAVLLFAPGAAAAESEWHSETPVAAGIGVPTPLGEIGDIEFWAPNRGVLIAAGVEGVMPAGVYAYDGTGWHLYSTVCGGHEGRIAWAGPDDFWTVSRYATPQEGVNSEGAESARTLCHFVGGQVVASYAEPYASVTAYPHMSAATCEGADDCWFAGETLPKGSANTGPFHLRWDGESLTDVPSMTLPEPQIEDAPGAVTHLAFLNGALVETATAAPFIREINLSRPAVFSEVPLPAGAAGPFALGGDGGQLWAVSTSGETALRSIGAGFEAVPLAHSLEGPVTNVAAEPNGAAAWAAGPSNGPFGTVFATVARIGADGSVSSRIVLPQPSEELDPKGEATALACPSAGQCWLGTSEGWLFHLGGSLPQDTDTAMHTLITFRPADNTTRSFVPAGVPEDNSGEVESSKKGEEVLGEPFPERRRRPNLVVKVKQRIVDKTILELSFTLRARAHVQLSAKVHKKVVAKTAKLTLNKGRHHLRLRLDPKQWPTGLDFQVHPVGEGSPK
jgi:hypothetical protein